MATAAKLKDSKWIKVIVSDRNPEAESQSIFVGGNNVVTDGKSEIRHFKVQPDKEVELPVSFVEQLETRARMAQDKEGNKISVPLYLVQRV